MQKAYKIVFNFRSRSVFHFDARWKKSVKFAFQTILANDCDELELDNNDILYVATNVEFAIDNLLNDLN